MHPSIKSLLLFGVVAGMAVVVSPSAGEAQSPADAQIATIKQYCVGCHSDKLKAGGASFEGMTVASLAKTPDIYELAVKKLRGRVMSPPGARQPDAKTVESLVGWLETSLDKIPTQEYIVDR